jgi:hypothetical protein
MTITRGKKFGTPLIRMSQELLRTSYSQIVLTTLWGAVPNFSTSVSRLLLLSFIPKEHKVPLSRVRRGSEKAADCD